MLNYTGATQLGILSYVMFCGNLIYKNYLYRNLNIFDLVLLCIATAALIVTIIINKNFKKENSEELKKVMMEYKKYVKTRREEMK